MANWSIQDYQSALQRQGLDPIAALGEAAPKTSKYNARKKVMDGITFDSAGEAECYRLLKSWETAGAITELRLQPVYVLQPKMRVDGKTQRAITYRADFEFVKEGKRTAVDFKGFKTQAFLIKEKLMRAKYPEIDLQIWTRNDVRRFR